MRLTLAWHGPLRAGALPVDSGAIAMLDVPAVYLRVKRYDNGRVIAYVGQSRHLIARIDRGDRVVGLLGGVDVILGGFVGLVGVDPEHELVQRQHGDRREILVAERNSGRRLVMIA